MNIYFDETQIDNDKVTGISYNSKLINDNDVFALGQTVCNSATLKVDKSLTTQPSVVTIEENNKTYTYNVDNVQEDKTSYIYTLVDDMVNFNFRYDAQPLIDASEHTEPDGTKYVTLLELVQDICSKADVSLITTDFVGYDKHITWYDNTVTAREYIGMVAELNGGYALIDEGLVFKKLTNGEIKSITGKNLLQNNGTTQTINGVTFTKTIDGTINVSGTASAQIIYNINDNVVLSGNYIMSGCPENGQDTTYFLQLYGTGGANEYGSGTQISNVNGVLRIVIRNGTQCNNLLFKPMIRLSNITDTTYEPYTNPNITIQDGTNTSLVGCNIEGNSYQYTTTGKNLLNITASGAYNEITVENKGNGYYRIYGTTGSSARSVPLTTTFPSMPQGQTFTYSISDVTGNFVGSFPIAIYNADSTVRYNYFSLTPRVPSQTNTMIANNGVQSINFYISADRTTDFTFRLQLEKNASATDFEPYTGGIASPNPDYPQEVEVVETYNLLNINRELGAPSNTTLANTTPRTFDLTKLVKGLSYNNYYNTGTVNSYSINGNSLTVNNKNIYGIGFPMLLQNGSYTLSYSSESISDVYIALYKTDGTSLSGYYRQNIAAGKVSYTFTIDSELVVVPIFASHTPDTDITFTNIQLEEGSAASGYVPYGNIGVNVVGKNLFNTSQTAIYRTTAIETTINNGVKVTDTAAGTNHSVVYKILDVSTLVGQSFTIKANWTASGSNLGRIGIGLCDENGGNRILGTYSDTSGTAITYTIPTITTSKYLAIWLYSNTSGTATANTSYVDYINIQLEKGSSASEYVPSSNITTPIDLQGNFIGKIGNIKDELNIDDLGNVILTKRIGKVVYDENSGVSVNATTNYTQLYMVAIDVDNVTSNGKGISNYFKYTYNNAIGNFYYSNSKNVVLVVDPSITNSTQAHTWLGTHNTEVYYVLKTPYQVNLGKANIELNEGVNYITFLTGLDTRNTIEYTSQDPEYAIDINDCESYNIGEYHKVTRVAIENGLFNPVGDEEGTTIYINPNNVFITEQSDLDSIYHKVKGFEYYSLEIKKGDIEIIPTGTCIALVKDNEIYKSYAQLSLNYNGGWYGKYHFITGSNKQEETAEINGVEDNYKRLKLQVDRDKNALNIVVEQTNSLQTRTDVLATNIDETTGDVREVTTTTGFTFNADGLNIYKNDTTFNTQINNIGTYYKDGDTILSQTTKDGTKTKDLDVFGYYRYGEDDINDEPLFIAVKYTDGNNEEGYGHFYNG